MTPKDYFNKGRDYFHKGEYEKAIKYLQIAVQNSNNNYPDASYNLGVIFQTKKSNTTNIAEFYYKKTIKDTGGKHSDSWNNLGVIYRERGLLSDAITCHENAINSTNGIHRFAYRNLGLIYENQGRFQLSIKYLEKAADESDYDSCLMLGKIYYRLGKKESSINYYKKSLLISNRNVAWTYMMIGKIYQQSKKYDKSIEALKIALNHSNNNYPEASYILGVAYHESFKYVEAIAAYNKVIIDSDNVHPNALYNIGDIYAKIGNSDLAIKYFKQAITDGADVYILPLFGLGIIYKDIGDFSTSIEYFCEVLTQLSNLDHLTIIDKTLNYTYVKSYSFFYLSICYLAINELSRAKAYSYEAQKSDNLNYSFNKHILNNFTYKQTISFYKNRIKYIILQIENNIKKLNFNTDKNLFNRYLKTFNKTYSPKELFLTLLKSEQYSLHYGISHQERLRLSYLISFLDKDYATTFYIIDELLDTEYDLDDLDYYCYFASSYLIGQPLIDLEYFLTITVNDNNDLGKLYNRQINSLKKAIAYNDCLDEYLIDIGTPFTLQNIAIDTNNYHPWIIEVIDCLTNDYDYKIPLTKNEINGLVSQFLTSFEIDLEQKNKHNQNWKNIEIYLKNNSTDYEQMIKNIRSAIKKGVSYQYILARLLEFYHSESDNTNKHNITILKSATLLSEVIYNGNKNLLNGNSETAITEILNHYKDEIISPTTLLLDLASSGLGFILSILTRTTIKFLDNDIERKRDDLFTELSKEIKY